MLTRSGGEETEHHLQPDPSLSEPVRNLLGVKGNDLQENIRVGITPAVPVDRHNSIKLYGSTGVFARTGSNFNTAGIAWQYRWGGGL